MTRRIKSRIQLNNSPKIICRESIRQSSRQERTCKIQSHCFQIHLHRQRGWLFYKYTRIYRHQHKQSHQWVVWASPIPSTNSEMRGNCSFSHSASQYLSLSLSLSISLSLCFVTLHTKTIHCERKSRHRNSTHKLEEQDYECRTMETMTEQPYRKQ